MHAVPIWYKNGKYTNAAVIHLTLIPANSIQTVKEERKRRKKKEEGRKKKDKGSKKRKEEERSKKKEERMKIFLIQFRTPFLFGAKMGSIRTPM